MVYVQFLRNGGDAAIGSIASDCCETGSRAERTLEGQNPGVQPSNLGGIVHPVPFWGGDVLVRPAPDEAADRSRFQWLGKGIPRQRGPV